MCSPSSRPTGSIAAFLHLAALLLALLAGSPAIAQAPVAIGQADFIARLTGHLGERKQDMISALARLGLDAEVATIRQGTASQIHAFAPDSIVESLYRRAEAAQAGEGDRLLALLYHDAASRSVAIRDDPVLRDFGQRFPEGVAKGSPIKMAPPASIESVTRASLSAAVEGAISTLADFHGAKGLASMKVTMLRTFKKPAFDSKAFDRALLAARSPEDALRRLIDIGTPPPSAEEGMRRLLGEAIDLSAALGVDKEASRLMQELSQESAPEHKQYSRVEDQLESRKSQYSEAAKAKLRGKETPSHDDLMAGLFKPPGSDPPAASGSSGGGGGGGSPSSQMMEKFAQNYHKFDRETFGPRESSTERASPRPAQSAPTSRSFSTARVSARAGRGVSVGAKFSANISQKVESAVWLANPQDPRFGRLFVTLRDSGQPASQVAASRPMFSDSFRAARDALWHPRDAQSAFHEGEILVIMSMDPGSNVTEESEQRFEAKLEGAIKAAMTAAERSRWESLTAAVKDKKNDALQRLQAAMERETLMEAAFERMPPQVKAQYEKEMEALDAQRGIVLHPSLAGKELAWSAARVDFWTNRPQLLKREASLLSGEQLVPAAFNVLPLPDMSTWQYYERDAVVDLGPGTSGARALIVNSVGAQPNSRSHLAVALFSEDKGSDGVPKEDGLYLRPEASRKMQPVLDWLATRHHDFMRLNDFSESLTLLRWLKTVSVQVKVVSATGDPPLIAIPDRVDIQKGPKIGN